MMKGCLLLKQANSSDMIFKECPKCKSEWNSRADFLSDPEINIIGYQVNFKQLELGLFLFNHLSCKTTVSIAAKEFSDLYNGPYFQERKTGSDSCPSYCLNKSELRSCPEACECAYVRQVVDKVNRWEKKTKISNRFYDGPRIKKENHWDE